MGNEMDADMFFEIWALYFWVTIKNMSLVLLTKWTGKGRLTKLRKVLTIEISINIDIWIIETFMIHVCQYFMVIPILYAYKIHHSHMNSACEGFIYYSRERNVSYMHER